MAPSEKARDWRGKSGAIPFVGLRGCLCRQMQVTLAEDLEGEAIFMKFPEKDILAEERDR